MQPSHLPLSQEKPNEEMWHMRSMAQEATVKAFVTFSGFFSIGVGLLGLAGCVFHKLILRTILPGSVAITANTAVCLILLGFSACYLPELHARAGLIRKLTKTAAAVAGIVGLLSLLEATFNLSFGIDELLFAEVPGALLGHIRPGLMSPITAVNFVLLGFAIAFPYQRSRGGLWMVTFAALAAEIISVVTSSVLILSPDVRYLHIAIPTALTLSILPLGIAGARLTAYPRFSPVLPVSETAEAATRGLLRSEAKVMLVLLMGAIFPLVLCLDLGLFFATARHINEPLHECLELLGSFIALVVALLLSLRAQYEDEVPMHFIWVTSALGVMGTLDGAHAIAPFGIAWSWLRHGATLLGGLIFALVWVPLPKFIRRTNNFFLFVIGISIAISLLVWLCPALLPAPWGPNGYSFWAKSANIVGGLGFLTAAVFFLLGYVHQPQVEKLIFGCQTLLKGVAGAAFGFSHLWAADWWTWHVLRFLGFAIVAAVIYEALLGQIKERKQAEADLRESEDKVRGLNIELEARVQERTAQLSAAMKELEGFSYTVAHDLRAPLRGISGFSKLVMEDFAPQLSPELQHYLDRIDKGARSMAVLVDEFLNFARVNRESLRLRSTPLKAVVDSVIQLIMQDSPGRQIEWRVGDLPAVECDPVLIKQVFQNLLSNAAKFTSRRGTAVIEIGQKVEQGESVIYVRDNGVGFDMKYASKLFGVFQRLHRVDEFEGVGVGLATVQSIVQKHGGRVWAEAELDKGATFCFTLRTAKGDLARAVAAGIGGDYD